MRCLCSQVMHCNVKDMEGMQNLPNLEKLWLNENNITRISGLENATKLKELYLCVWGDAGGAEVLSVAWNAMFVRVHVRVIWVSLVWSLSDGVITSPRLRG